MTRLHNRCLLCIALPALVFFLSCAQGGGSRARGADADSATSPESLSVIPNYNVFVETSGSMAGYLDADPSEFVGTVTSIITAIKSYGSDGLVDSLNLFYLGGDKSKGMKDFKDKLKASSFRNIATGVSDFDSFFDTLLHHVSEKEVAMLASDMIFSPKKTEQAKIHNYLENQRSGIQDKFDTKLDSLPLSTLLLKYSSAFAGKYFNRQGTGKNIDAIRPYYLIIAGKPEFIDALISKIDFRRFNGFEAIHLFSAPASVSRAKIIYSRKESRGSFDFEKPATRLKVYDAKADNGVFQFPVAVDFSKIQADEEFFLNKDNYRFSAQSSNYEIAGISRVNPAESQYEGFTHIILLKTTMLKPGKQEIGFGLKNSLPAWIKASNTDDDLDLKQVTDSARTFGFATLVQGIYDAYKNKYREADLFHITITVTK